MSDCIEWAGRRNQDGYGAAYAHGRQWRAHRLTWTEQVGPIPDGLNVLHRCDNPPCVNIEHLYLGTQADNVRDMLARNRRAKEQRKSPVCRVAGHDDWQVSIVNGRTKRQCRRCHRDRQREREAKQRDPNAATHGVPGQTHCGRWRKPSEVERHITVTRVACSLSAGHAGPHQGVPGTATWLEAGQ